MTKKMNLYQEILQYEGQVHKASHILNYLITRMQDSHSKLSDKDYIFKCIDKLRLYDMCYCLAYETERDIQLCELDNIIGNRIKRLNQDFTNLTTDVLHLLCHKTSHYLAILDIMKYALFDSAVTDSILRVDRDGASKIIDGQINNIR
jgi:hypothetical protein